MTRNVSRPLALSVILLSTWPVWQWFCVRTMDGSDEPLGVLALVTLLAFVAGRNVLRTPLREGEMVPPALFLAVYTISFHFVPPLLRAFLAMCALSALVLRGPGVLPLCGLCALSLPVVATMQFYCGYPLRAFAATTSAALLQAFGFGVACEGTILRYAGEVVMVDAPCSGIRMLWFGAYLICALGAFYRLDAKRTFLGACATLAIVLMANILRATILFFKETHLVVWPEWTHAAVGMVLFTFAALLVTLLARGMQIKPCVA